MHVILKIQTRVSVHQILVHFAVFLTSCYETKPSMDEINWFLMSKKIN